MTRERFESANERACVSCGAALQGPYCHACGERVRDARELRLGAFLRNSLGNAFDLDSRLFRTFRLLLTRPGMLTAEYVAGRRKAYLGPLQVFLLCNLIFFGVLAFFGGFNTFTTPLRYHLGQPVYGPVARGLVDDVAPDGSPERTAFIARFDETIPNYANSMVIFMAPLLAAVLALLHTRRRRYFVHHVVFALHFLGFMLLVVTAMPWLFRLVTLLVPAASGVIEDQGLLALLVTVVFTAYLVPATRRAYHTGAGRALVVGILAGITVLPIILVYRMILFFAVFLALR